MARTGGNETIPNAKDEVHALLAELDADAQRGVGTWSEKRRAARRAFHAPCRLYYMTREQTSVCTALGTTRDVSGGGISFVSPAHFVRRMELVVVVDTSENTTRCLPGVVVYSRCLRNDWYLTGVKFGAVDDFLTAAAVKQDKAARPAAG